MANWWRDYKLANPELASLPEKKRGRFGVHLERPGGVIEAHLTANPSFYEEAGAWKELDTEDVRDDGTHFWVPGVPTKIEKSNRKVKTPDGLYTQTSSRVGVFDSSSEKFTAKNQIPAGSLDGDSLVSGGVGWEHRITFTNSGIREELTLSQNPQVSGDYLVVETEVEGIEFPNGWVDHFEADGMQFPMPQAWDANGQRIECRRYALKKGQTQYLYTGVAVADLASAVYPVTIDPDYSSSTATYYEVQGQSGSYSTARSTSSTQVGGTTINCGQSCIFYTFYVNRAFLKFDTSSIPDSATIDQVNMKLACETIDSSPNQDIIIKKLDWSANDPLGTGNRETNFDACLAASTDAVWQNTSGLSTNTYYSSSNLDTTRVNKTGSTYYGVMCQRDQSNLSPTFSLGDIEGVSLYSPGHGTYPPVLTVAYTTEANLTVSQTESGDSTSAALDVLVQVDSDQAEAGDSTTASLEALIQLLASQGEVGDTAGASLQALIQLVADQGEGGDETAATLESFRQLTGSQAEGGDSTLAELQVLLELIVAQEEAGDSTAADLQGLVQLAASQAEAGDTTTATLQTLAQITASQTESGDITAASLQVLAQVLADQAEGGDTTAALLAGLIQVAASQTESGDTASAALETVVQIVTAQGEDGDSSAASLQVAVALQAALAELGDETAASLEVLVQVAASQDESGDIQAAAVQTTLDPRQIVASQTEGGDTTAAVLQSLLAITSSQSEEGDATSASFAVLVQLEAIQLEAGDATSGRFVEVFPQGEIIVAGRVTTDIWLQGTATPGIIMAKVATPTMVLTGIATQEVVMIRPIEDGS